MAEMEISCALQEKLEKAESLDEVIQACTEEGITVTKEQLEIMLSSDSENEGELSAEALDNVSGGGLFGRIRRYVRYSRASKYRGGGGGFSSGGGGNGSFGGGGGGGGIR